jgi:hypothetical protein
MILKNPHNSVPVHVKLDPSSEIRYTLYIFLMKRKKVDGVIDGVFHEKICPSKQAHVF